MHSLSWSTEEVNHVGQSYESFALVDPTAGGQEHGLDEEGKHRVHAQAF